MDTKIHEIEDFKLFNERNLLGHTNGVLCLLVWDWVYDNDEKKDESKNVDTNSNFINDIATEIKSHMKEEERHDILFTGSYDKSIRIWNLSNGDCLNVWNNTHNSTVSCLKQWNRWLISSGSEIRIWKIDEKTLNINQSTQTQQQGNCISILTPYTNYNMTGWISGLEIWNNSLVSVSEDKSIRIWKYEQSKLGKLGFICSQQIECDSSVFCVKLWNDCIATGHYDYSIRIWGKKSNGNTIDLINQFVGHESGVICLEVCNEGDNQLISGSWDCTIRLWNSNGECLSIFNGHHQTNSIAIYNGIIFSPQNATIKGWYLNGDDFSYMDDYTSFICCLKSHRGKLISGSDNGSIKTWILKKK